MSFNHTGSGMASVDQRSERISLSRRLAERVAQPVLAGLLLALAGCGVPGGTSPNKDALLSENAPLTAPVSASPNGQDTSGCADHVVAIYRHAQYNEDVTYDGAYDKTRVCKEDVVTTHDGRRPKKQEYASVMGLFVGNMSKNFEYYKAAILPLLKGRVTSAEFWDEPATQDVQVKFSFVGESHRTDTSGSPHLERKFDAISVHKKGTVGQVVTHCYVSFINVDDKWIVGDIVTGDGYMSVSVNEQKLQEFRTIPSRETPLP